MAWSFKNKGFERNTGALLMLLLTGKWRSFSHRVKVLKNKIQDPYDAYEWLDELHENYGLSPVYFFLVATHRGKYDKNISVRNKAFRELVHYLSGTYKIALHPSWASGDHPVLLQKDNGNFEKWEEAGARECSVAEKVDLIFSNIVCKHLKSNAITLVKNKQLIGKGCGQTSRIDALRHAVEKAKQFKFDLSGAVMASDAFFPFNDCVQLGHEAGITAFIQPGGSIRDKDSIDYCKQNNLAMVLTGQRHFRH